MYWRLEDPFKYLNKLGHECYRTQKGIPDAYKQGLLDWADIIIPQGCVDKQGLAVIYMYQQEKGKKIVIDQDDYLVLNKDNPHYLEHKMTDATMVVQRSIEIADMVTTTSDYLAERLREWNSNVVVLPNYMDFERWEFPYKPNESGRIRMGYCGSVTHWDDFRMIEKPLKRILTEFPNVTLVIIGDIRFKRLFKDYNNVEVMLGMPFDAWPAKLSGLMLDIGLAPLKDNEFNRCKSNIKWQEYSLNRIPGVYSTVVYGTIGRDFDGRWGLLADTPQQWYQCIKNLITCKALREDITESVYAHVHSRYSLDKHAYKWERAYKRVLR
jgi:glycosyltransferase involved in cell wall biosynthesis